MRKLLSKQESDQLQHDLMTRLDELPEELIDDLCDVVMKYTEKTIEKEKEISKRLDSYGDMDRLD